MSSSDDGEENDDLEINQTLKQSNPSTTGSIMIIKPQEEQFATRNFLEDLG